MSRKNFQALGWAVGTAVGTAVCAFFITPENISWDAAAKLPGIMIPSAAGAAMAWFKGLKTDPEVLDQKDRIDELNKKP